MNTIKFLFYFDLQKEKYQGKMFENENFAFLDSENLEKTNHIIS